MQTRRLRTALLSVGATLATAGLAWAAQPRLVEIRWDFTAEVAQKHLEIWINCTHREPDGLNCSNQQEVEKLISPAAEAFQFKATDRVALVAIFFAIAGTPDIKYAITGRNLDDKDLDALKKLFGASGESQGGSASQNKAGENPPKNAVTKIVNDPLIAGGKLTATFDLKTKDGDKEKVSATSGGIDFKVVAEAPRITVSYGLGLTTAANASVAINKTSTAVTFVKDGKAQQGYQQFIVLRDNDKSLKPIQSLMTLANFRLAGPLYFSGGVQINEKLFESPVVGGTYRLQLGKAGLNITGGVQFSHETEIVPASGFTDGELVDPTLGLTPNDIPTQKTWHRRLAIAVSLDFQ